jgi:hypothetical protein
MDEKAGLVRNCVNSHEETKSTALKRDEQQVQALVDHLNQTMTDPFDVEAHPTCLINISTGMHATKEVHHSLLTAVDEGGKMCEQFANSAFSVDQSGSFYNPIPKSKLKTFEHMTSKTNLKCKSGEIISGHINPELAFRRALVLANCRDDVTIENVLSHPIGLIPVSLFHDDGTMRKSCKSDLVKRFESDVASVLSLPDFDRSVTTYIRDAMAVVQCTDVKKYKTFGDLAADYYRTLVLCFTFANTVADIFDRYDIKNSIKSAERERRSKVSVSSKVFQVIEGRTIPDWKKFLSVQENKQTLINFFGTYFLQIVGNDPVVQPGHTLYVAGIFGNPEVVKVFSRADGH